MKGMAHTQQPGVLGALPVYKTGGMHTISRSLRASNHAPNTEVVESLQDRLRELLIFELNKEGDRRYLSLSVRGLYKHVLNSITYRSPARPRSPTAVDTTIATSTMEPSQIPTLPLGQAALMETVGKDTEVPPRSPRMTEGSLQATRTERSHSVADQAVSYRERLGGYLHPRDMRRLVTPFSKSNEPDIIVRRHVMLLNFDPLRAIILRDRVLVLVPDGADSILVELEKRIRGGFNEVEHSVFGDDESLDEMKQEVEDEIGNSSRGGKLSFLKKLTRKGKKSSDDRKDEHADSTFGKGAESQVTEDFETELEDLDDDEEWNEMKGQEWVDLPFELQCMDACLHIVGGFLTKDTKDLQEASLRYIRRILKGNSLRDDPLTIIRVVKDATNELNGSVRGFTQALSRLLSEDEDMALCNLSHLITNPELFIQPVSQEALEQESDEPELILESHLQTGLTLLNTIDLLKGQMDTIAELVDQRLDASRNHILLANMIISIVSLCVSVASLVGSFFGMNLINELEDQPDAFNKVTFGTAGASVGLGILIIGVLFYTGTIPRVGIGEGVD